MKDLLMNRDLFGNEFRMRLDSGNTDLRSYVGSLMSLLVTFLVIIFAYLKAVILMHKKDVDILSTSLDNYFTPNDIFDYDNDQLNVAVAFTAYDSETEPILDPSYGELVFNHYNWGVDSDGLYESGRTRIRSTHTCSFDELGLGEDVSKSRFMPLYTENAGIIKSYQKKF